jgi:tRNA threonylcarbamoyladenosine biosynthesis protein TsaE
MEITYQEEQIADVAREVLHTLEASVRDGATVLALSGDLGAGKTTLTKALGKLLGVTEELASPTFIIMRRHETIHPRFQTLYHIDAYRLESATDIQKLGFHTLLADSNALIVVEWPERLGDALPEDTLRAEITHVSQTERKLHL